MLQKNKNSKVVVIGGGTGSFTVLSGLRKYPLDLSAIISMADDGGSTGILREEFGILPPGDVRRALVALSRSDRLMSDLFNYRFNQGGLKGHSFGNIMLTALERITGSFEGALVEASRILNVEGKVIPVTLDNIKLCANLENGKKIKGESNIDIPEHDPRLKITKIFLEPQASINPHAAQAIMEANLIVLGPGDLYTSIIPNLLVKGVAPALKKTPAKKVFVVSTMTKPGETLGFKACNYLATLEKYLGKNVLDYLVVNNKKPSQIRLKQYQAEGKEMVEPGNLPQKPVPIFGNFIRQEGFVRHDPDLLAKTLVSLL